MHITLNRTDLLRALARTYGAAGDSSIPILGTALLGAEAGALTVTTTDLTLQVAASAPAEVEAPGRAAPPSARLYDVVRRLPDRAQVLLELTPAGLTIRAGRARFTLPSLPPEDFPTFPQVGADAPAVTLPGGDLAALAETALACAARDEDPRAYLRGGYLCAAGDALRMVATDGHRLSQRDVPLPGGAAFLPVTVPRRALELFAKLGGESVAMTVTGTLIRAATADLAITSKLVDGAFPDYTRVVPLGNDNVVGVNRGALTAAAGRMQAATERGYCAAMTARDGTLRLAVSDPESGSSAEEDLPCEYDGEEVTVGVNSRYLAEALAVLTCEVVAISVLDGMTPLLVQGRGEDDVLLVLVPMRI